MEEGVRKNKWLSLLEELSRYPEPASPLCTRLAHSLFLALIMPVMWPLMMGMMFVVLFLVLAVFGVALLMAPVWVALGIKRETTEHLSVEVDKDRVALITELVRHSGGKVSRG